MRWSYSDGDYRKGDGLNPGEVPLGPTRERRAGKWKKRYGGRLWSRKGEMRMGDGLDGASQTEKTGPAVESSSFTN